MLASVRKISSALELGMPNASLISIVRAGSPEFMKYSRTSSVRRHDFTLPLPPDLPSVCDLELIPPPSSSLRAPVLPVAGNFETPTILSPPQGFKRPESLFPPAITAIWKAAIADRQRGFAGLYTRMMHDRQSRSATGTKAVKRSFLNGRMPLCYTEWPHEGAPLAILVHGSRDHSRSWDALAKVLLPHYHVIAPDLRGHGDSSWSQDGRYDFAAYLSDLGALTQHLALGPQRQAVLIGHSLGAHIALRFAGTFPETIRRIVAIEAIGAPPAIEAYRLSQDSAQSLRNWFEERHAASLTTPRLFASIDEAVERMRERHAFLTPAQARHMTRHGLRPADLLAAVPDMREVRLPGSGHWPQHDAFDACVSAIMPFLAE